MASFSSTDNWRKELDLRALRQFHNLIYHLIYRLFLNLTATFRTMWNSDSRI